MKRIADKKKVLLQLLKSLVVVGFSFVIVWVYAKIALNLSFLNPISEVIANFSITDKYYQMMPERGNRSVVIVDLGALYNRGDIAMTLEAIESCQPAVVAVDCVFKGEKDDTLADNAIRRVAESYDNLVFSYELLDEQADGSGFRRSVHSFFVDEIPIREGVANMQRDNLYNGIKRSLRLGWLNNGEKQLSLVGEVMNLYAGSEAVKADNKDVNINFAPTQFTVLDPAEVLQSRDLIEGRIVLFGSMTDENDMHYTPLGKMAGVTLLAYATQTLLEHRQIITPGWFLHGLISLLVVMLTNLLQLIYLRWTNHSKNPMVYHVLGSAYVLGVVTFLWIAVVIWFTFLCFGLYNLNIELRWSIAAMAFLATSRSFYIACKEYYIIWKVRSKQKKA